MPTIGSQIRTARRARGAQRDCCEADEEETMNAFLQWLADHHYVSLDIRGGMALVDIRPQEWFAPQWVEIPLEIWEQMP